MKKNILSLPFIRFSNRNKHHKRDWNGIVKDHSSNSNNFYKLGSTLLLLTVFLFLPLLYCQAPDYPLFGHQVSKSADKIFTRFYFDTRFNPEIQEEIDGLIDNSARTITLEVPFGIDVTQLTPSFTINGFYVMVGEELQISDATQNDFTDPLIYSLYAVDLTSVQYTVTVNYGLSYPVAPEATDLNISGTLELGWDLTLNYTYTDLNGDAESESLFQWLVSDTLEGEYTPITGANSAVYTIEEAMLGKYFKCQITPVSELGPTGEPTVGETITTEQGVGPAREKTAKVVLTEIYTEDSEDQFELYVIDGGNIGNLTFYLGSLSDNLWTFSFPDIEVETGSYIVGWTQETNPLHYVKTGNVYDVYRLNAGDEEFMSISIHGAVFSVYQTSWRAGDTEITTFPVDMTAATSDNDLGGTAQERIDGINEDGGGDDSQWITRLGVASDKDAFRNHNPLSGESLQRIWQSAPVDTNRWQDWFVDSTSIGDASPVSPSAPPEALDVAITDDIGADPDDPAPDELLRGQYYFYDINGDVEGESTYRWLRADSAADLSTLTYSPIAGATEVNYTLTNDDLGTYLIFEITPVADSATDPIGSSVQSTAVPVKVPVASDVLIAGTLSVGETLTASYTFDGQGYTQANSDFRWLSSDDVMADISTWTEIDSGTLTGSDTDDTYVIQPADNTRYLIFEIIPKTSVGIGEVQYSAPVFVGTLGTMQDLIITEWADIGAEIDYIEIKNYGANPVTWDNTFRINYGPSTSAELLEYGTGNVYSTYTPIDGSTEITLAPGEIFIVVDSDVDSDVELDEFVTNFGVGSSVKIFRSNESTLIGSGSGDRLTDNQAHLSDGTNTWSFTPNTGDFPEDQEISFLIPTYSYGDDTTDISYWYSLNYSATQITWRTPGKDNPAPPMNFLYITEAADLATDYDFIEIKNHTNDITVRIDDYFKITYNTGFGTNINLDGYWESGSPSYASEIDFTATGAYIDIAPGESFIILENDIDETVYDDFRVDLGVTSIILRATSGTTSIFFSASTNRLDQNPAKLIYDSTVDYEWSETPAPAGFTTDEDVYFLFNVFDYTSDNSTDVSNWGSFNDSGPAPAYTKITPGADNPDADIE